MTMSIAMAAGMNALIGINNNLQDYQAQALSGKKVNSAADGLAAYLSAQTYSDRSNRLMSINSTLNQNMSTIKAASQGLTSIGKTISYTLDVLKAASQTQAQVVGTGGTFAVTADNTTQGSMVFAALTAAGGYAATNANTTFVNANNNYVTMGGQRLAQGNVYSFSSGGTTKFFRIAAAADAKVGAGNGTTANDPQNVATIGDVQNLINGMNAVGAQANSSGYIATNTVANGAGNQLTLNVTVNNAINADGSSNTTFGLGISNLAAGVANNASQMLTGVRNAAQANATYSVDNQTVGGAAGVGQTATLTGQKNVYTAGVGAVAADTKRAAAAVSYKLALSQIDQFLKDASVSGVNLLNGDSLLATFNEKGTTTTLQLQNNAGAATSYGSTGLGLTNAVGAQDYANNFATNADAVDGNGNVLTGLQAAITKLTTAQTTLQTGVAQVSQFQSTVQNRVDFNSAIVSLLNDTSNNLTAADMTEVSAKTAALQVQQSFAQAILSATKQSDQSMLQLLR